MQQVKICLNPPKKLSNPDPWPAKGVDEFALIRGWQPREVDQRPHEQHRLEKISRFVKRRRAQALKLRLAGKTYSQIAALLHSTEGTISADIYIIKQQHPELQGQLEKIRLKTNIAGARKRRIK